MAAVSIPPVTLAEKTKSKRLPAATGISSPVTVPLLVEPTPRTPVRGGVRVVNAPGITVKVSSGVVDWYNWTDMVMVVPTRLSVSLVLK